MARCFFPALSLFFCPPPLRGGARSRALETWFSENRERFSPLTRNKIAGFQPCKRVKSDFSCLVRLFSRTFPYIRRHSPETAFYRGFLAASASPPFLPRCALLRPKARESREKPPPFNLASCAPNRVRKDPLLTRQKGAKRPRLARRCARKHTRSCAHTAHAKHPTPPLGARPIGTSPPPGQHPPRTLPHPPQPPTDGYLPP